MALAREKGLPDAACEQVWVCALSSGNELRAFEPVAMGGFDSCPVDVPALLRAVLVARGSRFVVVHNHPGGDLTPSSHDIDLDLRIQTAAQYVGLRLTGHMIVSSEGWRWME